MNETLDLRGLKCPLPALLAKKALAKLAPGTGLMVWCDDPMAVVDIPHMCHREGHAVETATACDGFHAFALRAGVTPGDSSASPPAPGG